MIIIVSVLRLPPSLAVVQCLDLGLVSLERSSLPTMRMFWSLPSMSLWPGALGAGDDLQPSQRLVERCGRCATRSRSRRAGPARDRALMTRERPDEPAPHRPVDPSVGSAVPAVGPARAAAAACRQRLTWAEATDGSAESGLNAQTPMRSVDAAQARRPAGSAGSAALAASVPWAGRLVAVGLAPLAPESRPASAGSSSWRPDPATCTPFVPSTRVGRATVEVSTTLAPLTTAASALAAASWPRRVLDRGGRGRDRPSRRCRCGSPTS